jgi:type III secretion protein V
MAWRRAMGHQQAGSCWPTKCRWLRGALPPTETATTLAAAVREALRRNAGLFLGIQETTNLLTRASGEVPDVVKEVLRALPMQRVADVLRRLVAEGVSIRNLRDILEALAETGQREKDAHALTEFARIALKRQLSHQVAPSGHLRALLLLPDLEDTLRQAVRTSGGVSQLALEPELSRRLVDGITASVARHKPQAIVCAIDVRWHVRKLIEPECFDTPVLSFHELMPTLQLEVADRLALPGAALLEAA